MCLKYTTCCFVLLLHESSKHHRIRVDFSGSTPRGSGASDRARIVFDMKMSVYCMKTLLFAESIEIPLFLVTLMLLYPAYGPLWVILLSAFMYFYRLPGRHVDTNPDLIVAPSDGKVLEIVHLANGFTQIKVYLSIFDVHAQWAPVDGQVTSVTHKPGEFNLAHILEKSDFNERTSTVFRSCRGNVRVDQIAGQVARRIVNWCETGQVMSKGELMGMIKLSSRVDLFLPTDHVTLCVNQFDTVRGGESRIAEWK